MPLVISKFFARWVLHGASLQVVFHIRKEIIVGFERSFPVCEGTRVRNTALRITFQDRNEREIVLDWCVWV